MFYVAARKDTQVELEKGGNNLDFTNSTQRNAFRSSLCTNYGIVDSNLSLFYVAESNATVARIQNGEAYTLTWTASAPDGEVDGFDFSTEDAKKWLQFSANKSSLVADGVESVIISASLLKADKSGIDTTFGSAIDVSVVLPGRNSKLRFLFSSGQASCSMKFDIGGTLYLGSKVSGYRCDNTLTIDIVE